MFIASRRCGGSNCFAVRFMFLGVLSALTPLAHAQQAGTAALDEIVVTAQKREQRLQDVPITVTEISGDDLARANVRTASDLPSMVSGLVWSNQGAWVLPSLRGISTSVSAIGSSSPVAIYLDGVYQPMEAGSLTDLPDVQRIEVLKGPQGTLFGRNATGGAISIYTLDPSFTPTGKISATAGIFDGGSSRDSGHYNVNGFFSGPLIDNILAGSISANFDRTNGYMTNDLTGEDAGRINSQVVRGKLLWTPTDGISILGTAYYIHREDGVAMAGYPFGGLTAASLYTPSVVPTQPWHYAYDGPAPDVKTASRGASLKGTFDLGVGTLTSISAFSNSNVPIYGTSAAAYSPSCIAVFSCVTAYILVGAKTASQEFDFASNKIGQFRYVVGLYGFYNQASEHDAYNAGVFTDDTLIKNKSYAAFGEGTYEFTDQFSAIGGVRVTQEKLNADGSFLGAVREPYADKTWTSTTPRGSLEYKFNQAVNAYFTYSQGFKAGVVSGQSNVAPPANPERITSYEIGIKMAEPRYRMNLAAFYYDYKDLQVETLIDAGTITVPQNAARAKIVGIDFDGAVKWSDRFETRLDTTYLARAEYSSFPHAITYLPPLGPFGLATDSDYDASGSRMLVAPLWSGTVSADYTQPVTAGVLEADLSLYYSSGYRWVYTGVVETHSYETLGTRISFTPTASKLKYSLYGKNLTNKAYVDGVTPNPVSAVSFYAPPRELGVTVDYSF
jgi:iron complex outermembrane receptor protein